VQSPSPYFLTLVPSHIVAVHQVLPLAVIIYRTYNIYCGSLLTIDIWGLVNGTIRLAIKNRSGSQVDPSGSGKFSFSPNLAI
jgi:hypothetical protein